MKKTLLITLAAIATASALTNEHISPKFIESVDRANEERPRRKLGWWGVALFFGKWLG